MHHLEPLETLVTDYDKAHYSLSIAILKNRETGMPRIFTSIALFSGAALALSGMSWAAENSPADSLSSHEAVKLSIGDSRVNGALLQPYDNVFLYSVTNKEGRVLVQGLWSDHLQKVSSGDQSALLRVQGMTYVNGKTASTVNKFDSITLRPISSRRQSIDGAVLQREFAGTHIVTKHIDPAGAETLSSFDVDAPAFDFNGGMYGLLLATLPLQAGFSATFGAVEEAADAASVENVAVVGEELIKAGALGTVRAWRTEVERAGKYKMTFWLVKAAPYVLKLRYKSVDAPEVWEWNVI